MDKVTRIHMTEQGISNVVIKRLGHIRDILEHAGISQDPKISQDILGNHGISQDILGHPRISQDIPG